MLSAVSHHMCSPQYCQHCCTAWAKGRQAVNQTFIILLCEYTLYMFGDISVNLQMVALFLCPFCLLIHILIVIIHFVSHKLP